MQNKYGFTGCGKSRFWCHSERSEESLFDLSPMHREILRFAQNDKRTFSAASLAADMLERELQNTLFGLWSK
jgi:hypothetical protein